MWSFDPQTQSLEVSRTDSSEMFIETQSNYIAYLRVFFAGCLRNSTIILHFRFLEKGLLRFALLSESLCTQPGNKQFSGNVQVKTNFYSIKFACM